MNDTEKIIKLLTDIRWILYAPYHGDKDSGAINVPPPFPETGAEKEESQSQPDNPGD